MVRRAAGDERTIEDLREFFERGFASGRRAGELIPPDAPFTLEQRAWLQGFLSGVFGLATSGAASVPEAASTATASTATVTPPLVPVAPAPLASGSELSFSRDNPVAVKLDQVLPALASADSLQSAVLALENSGVSYEPGDRLGVCPQNEPENVRQVLRLLGARAQESLETPRTVGPAWRVLLEQVDLARPTPELLELLATHARARDEAARLATLVRARDGEPSVIGLLRRFPSSKPPLSEFVAALAPLEPMLYPIASSPLADPQRLQFLLRAGPSGAAAQGLGPHAFVLGRLKPGEWLPVYVQPGPRHVVPEDDTVPLIVWADELGLAPARAVVQHRLAQRARGRIWVVSTVDGANDYPYRGDFEHWHAQRQIHRLDAVARDPGSGVIGPSYIEAMLEPFWRWIVDGSALHVFAGSPEALAAIEAALCRMLEERGKLDRARAREKLESVLRGSRHVF